MKKIKRSIVLIFAVLAISASMFSSCKKGDDSPKATLMNHKWELTTVETTDEALKGWFDLTFVLVRQTYEFNKDGKYTISVKAFIGPSQTEDGGTWSISDDGTELTMNGEVSDIIELTSKVLKIGPSDAIMGGFSEENGSGVYDYTLVFNAK